LTLGRKTAQEKVASYLMRIQKASGESLNIALPMTRQEIADFLGLTIETVSRVISSFKRNGLVTNLCAERMQIADIETMESLANAW
jgi:CRP-like cAMP-binding protein